MNTTNRFGTCWLLGLCCRLCLPALGQTNAPAPPPSLEFIRISPDGRHFVTADSGRKFTPWGCNYDHDRTGRLLEQYWATEWNTVVQDFAAMKALGANTVRIHLQVAHFMKSASEPNPAALQRLGQLVSLAERTGLYLDLTGLGCYDKTEVPPWYNALNETQRWEVQARFWNAVAQTCHKSPAVFCYDLMNEPIVTEDQTNRDWTPGAFGDRYYVQRITVDFAGRTAAQIARAWVDKLATAIHRQDAHHLLTVGEIPWALYFPGAQPLFQSAPVGGQLDFVSVHFYPKQGEVDQALKALAVYDVGKPILIEEIYPLHCPQADLAQFIDRSQPIAAGWIGFYWGETIAEYRQPKGTISDAITAGWLDYFSKKAPDMQAPAVTKPAPGNP